MSLRLSRLPADAQLELGARLVIVDVLGIQAGCFAQRRMQRQKSSRPASNACFMVMTSSCIGVECPKEERIMRAS